MKPATNHPWRHGKKPEMKSKVKAMDAANALASAVILQNPEKYAGLMAEWARRVAEARTA